MSKLTYLKDAASSGRWDIICVTETHLLSVIPDSFVAIPDYILFVMTPQHLQPSMVCVLTNISSVVLTPSSNHFPMPRQSTYVFDVYCLLVCRPPSNSQDADDSVLNLITEFCVGKEVILLSGR